MTTRRLFILFLVLGIGWFGTLGVRPLYKADESRYAEIPREMVASGDWTTPRLNGFKYFEKPPLQYWATAAAFEVFGEHDWTARLWTALLGFAGLLMTLRAGNRLFGRPAGFYAAAILAGAPLYVMLAQVNTLDMGVSFFLAGAVFAFALGHRLVFWAACALAVLSKGLIGIVLPLAAIGLYVLLKRDWALIRRMRPIAGPLLFLAITAPWFIAVSAANPEFAHFFFIQEHFQRFTTKMHGRSQPAWYFIPIFLFGMAPWLLPLFASLGKRLRPKLAEGSAKGSGKGFDASLFLVLWALIVFVFFSVSGSKLPSYILPIFPALAVLTGAWIAAAAPRRLLIAQGGVIALLAIVVAALVPRLASSYAEYVPWLVGAALVAGATGVAASALAWRKALGGAVLALAFAGFACTQLALVGHRVLAPRFSAQSLIQSAGVRLPPDVPVFAVEGYDHTIPWYLRRTVTMVGYKDELDKAIEWERWKFLPDLASFARAWQAAPRAYAVVTVSEFDRLRSELPMETLSRDPRYVLVRKP